MLGLVGRCSLIIMAFSFGSIAYSDSFEVYQRALGLITSTAESICGEASTKGEGRSSELQGSVQAQLRGLASKLAGVGISGSGKVASEEYQNVVREDLAANLRDIRACKLRVVETLKDALLQPSVSAPASPAQTLPDRRHQEQPAPLPMPNQLPAIQIVKCKVGRDQFFICQYGMACTDPQSWWSTGIGSVNSTGDSSCPVVIGLFTGANLCISDNGNIFRPFEGTNIGHCELCDAVGRCRP